MLAGTIAPDAGQIDGGDAAVRTLQATSVFPSLTPLEHVLVASAGRRSRAGFFRSLFATPQHRAEDAAFVAEAETILARFGLPRDGPAGELSAGDQRVLMLAAAYATGAPVLLVDEPTAGASADRGGARRRAPARACAARASRWSSSSTTSRSSGASRTTSSCSTPAA